MPTIPSEVLNGRLYKGIQDADNPVFTEGASIDDVSSKMMGTLTSYINDLKNIIIDNKGLILSAYGVIKDKTNNLITINRKRDFIDLHLAMHNYHPYINGMVEYINLILSLKPGEVSTDAVKDKLVTALSKDENWVKDQFMIDNNNISDGMDKIVAILDCMTMLNEMRTAAQNLMCDNSDESLSEVKTNAHELIWTSLNTFAAMAVNASRENIKSIQLIMAGKRDVPADSTASGYAML